MVMSTLHPRGKVARLSATKFKQLRLSWIMKYENNAVVARIEQEIKISNNEATALLKYLLKFLGMG